jgi:glycosyltransferase involved in cell wall biosynthesis
MDIGNGWNQMKEIQRPIKVLHAPRDIGGNGYYLARGERDWGFDSKNMVYFKQWYGYEADFDLKMKVDDNPVYYLRWWWTMVKVALTYDVLHFNFGSSFLSYYPNRWLFVDLPLWRSLGLATFVTFQGCEARIRSYVLGNIDTRFCSDCPSHDFCRDGYDVYKKETIALAGRYFDKIFVLNPDILHNIPEGQFLPYCNCDLEEWKPPAGYDWYHNGPVRVLHAPTNREIKGTKAIINAVELILIEKIAHNQVKSLYRTADLLVDQILIGWYGGLAVELMALGKPVVAYIREEDLRFIPPAMKNDLPIISANAEILKHALRRLIYNADLRKEIGEKSRDYVEKWHHPRVVAKFTTEAYKHALAKRAPVCGIYNRVRTIKKVAAPSFRIFATLFRNNWLPTVLLRRLLRQHR